MDKTIFPDGVNGLPLGGDTGQVLAKKTNTAFDTEWVDQSGGYSYPTLPTNLIPQMTSDTAPSGAASAGSLWSGVSAFWVMTTAQYGWISNYVPGANCWIKYDFGSVTAVNSYSFAPWSQDSYGQRSPTSWTFEGSNDDATWDVLDTRTMTYATRRIVTASFQQYRGVWLQVAFNLSTEASYRYYRLYISAYQSSSPDIAGLADFSIYATRIDFVP